MHQVLSLSARPSTMAPVEIRKPSIKFIQSFYSGERKLFSRMTSSLEIDGDLAFKIISYWLWLEVNINEDLIHAIYLLSDDGLEQICSLGKQVLINAAKSDSPTARKALSGVNYFLKAVCCKAMDRAEYENAKNALQELDLEEFLCNPDPSLAKLYLSSEDGAGGSSSVLRGMRMKFNKDSLSSIPDSSSSRASTSSHGSYIGGNNRELSSLMQPHYGHISHGGSTGQQSGMEKRFLGQQLQDSAQNSSLLSATAEAYYPCNASYSGFSGLIPAPPLEQIILPHIPTAFAQSSTSVPLVPAFTPQSGANIPALAPQSCAVMPHILVFSPQSSAFVPQVHISALAPQSGAVVSHVPVVAPQCRAVVSHIPALAPQSSAAVPQIPAVSMQIGVVLPFQNANVSQSPPGSTGMNINTQSMIQPTPVLAPTGRHNPDERKLFVTFSNGSPLSADELVQFFARHYNVDVESVYIEQPNTERPPKYAHVTFYHQENVEIVLAGKTTMKFRVNGKHLWVRRFIPGRRRQG